GLPLGLGLAVLLQRGAAPQAALVLRVLPEVVVVVADLLDARDLLLRIQDRKDVGLQLLEAGRDRQLGVGAGVLLPRPVQRLVAGDVLQPEVGIGVGGGVVGHGWRLLFGGRLGGGVDRNGEGGSRGGDQAGGGKGAAGRRQLGHGTAPVGGMAKPQRYQTTRPL